MKSHLLFVFLFLLVLTPFVSAQPPTATQVVINLEAGLNIDFPKLSVSKQGGDFTFHFHIFNATTGLIVDNSTVNCTFELFNEGGRHIIEDTDVRFIDDDWEAIIFGDNFTRLGSYSWLINCQSPSAGGFISSPFEITADGSFEQTFPKEFSVILFGLLLIVFGLSKERYRMLKHIGGILWIVMGVLTLYPGYGLINWTTLLGKAVGFILIGGGFYVWLEDSFSRDDQDAYFEQGGEKEEKEVKD